MTVQALFVDPKGPYPGLLGVDNCWDVDRDARYYDGAEPVVCHPPCQLWVNLAAVNWKRYQRERPAWYPGGSDRGCFSSALLDVFRCGGVLEHPASTHAWAEFGIPAPPSSGWGYCASLRLWVCEVWQSAYGHAARKRTWLVYHGAWEPFELNWSREPGTHQVGWFDRKKPTLGKRAASETPVEFAKVLIALAEHSRKSV